MIDASSSFLTRRSRRRRVWIDEVKSEPYKTSSSPKRREPTDVIALRLPPAKPAPGATRQRKLADQPERPALLAHNQRLKTRLRSSVRTRTSRWFLRSVAATYHRFRATTSAQYEGVWLRPVSPGPSAHPHCLARHDSCPTRLSPYPVLANASP